MQNEKEPENNAIPPSEQWLYDNVEALEHVKADLKDA